MSVFADRLKELRLSRGENQSDVAKLLGVSVQSYSAYEGAREPKFEFVCKLAQHYNVSADYLLGLTEYRNKATERMTVSDIGLSQEAIDKLTKWHNIKNGFKPLTEGNIQLFNELITKIDWRATFDYSSLKHTRKVITNTDADLDPDDVYDAFSEHSEAWELVKQSGNVLLSAKDAIRFYANEIGRACTEALLKEDD